MKTSWWQRGVAVLGLAALSTAASAAVCTGAGEGNNFLYGEIPEASACEGMFSGNTPNAQITAFGESWDFLAKQPGAEGPFPGALSFTVDVGSGGVSGTWTINLAALPAGQYNSFVIALKPDGGFGYFLVENVLSGTWNTDSGNISPCPTGFNCAGFGLSHLSLYGRFDDSLLVPEPSTLALLGLSLLGFVGARRRKSSV